MLGPIQHTSMPFDPARPLVTAPHSPPPEMPSASLQPLPPADNGRDQFERRQGEQQEDAAERDMRRQQQRAEAMRAFNGAWARLGALQRMAHAALGDGDGPQAREAALEAAAVAVSIRDALPGVSAGAVDVPMAVDSARAGVGAALGVVDLAGTYPAHPVEDRIAINGARHRVIEAMAGVEAVAAELLAPVGTVILTSHLDVKA